MSGFRAFVKGCITKKPYRNLSLAEKRIAQVKRENGTILRAYLCDICGNYHVTKAAPRYTQLPAQVVPTPAPKRPGNDPKVLPPLEADCASGTATGYPCTTRPQVFRDGAWYCNCHKNPSARRPITHYPPDRPNILITSANAVGKPRIVA